MSLYVQSGIIIIITYLHIIPSSHRTFDEDHAGLMYCGSTYHRSCVIAANSWSCHNPGHYCNNIPIHSPTALEPTSNPTISPTLTLPIITQQPPEISTTIHQTTAMFIRSLSPTLIPTPRPILNIPISTLSQSDSATGSTEIDTNPTQDADDGQTIQQKQTTTSGTDTLIILISIVLCLLFIFNLIAIWYCRQAKNKIQNELIILRSKRFPSSKLDEFEGRMPSSNPRGVGSIDFGHIRMEMGKVKPKLIGMGVNPSLESVVINPEIPAIPHPYNYPKLYPNANPKLEPGSSEEDADYPDPDLPPTVDEGVGIIGSPASQASELYSPIAFVNDVSGDGTDVVTAGCRSGLSPPLDARECDDARSDQHPDDNDAGSMAPLDEMDENHTTSSSDSDDSDANGVSYEQMYAMQSNVNNHLRSPTYGSLDSVSTIATPKQYGK